MTREDEMIPGRRKCWPWIATVFLLALTFIVIWWLRRPVAADPDLTEACAGDKWLGTLKA